MKFGEKVKENIHLYLYQLYQIEKPNYSKKKAEKENCYYV